MTVKDFFVVVVKVLALYFFFSGIIPLVTQLILYREIYDASQIIELAGIILLFIAIIYFMLSQATTIVKLLKLDKGFSTDRFDFSGMNSRYVLEATICILGFYMVFFVVPYILIDAYTLIKSNINSRVFSLDETAETLQANLITNFLYILVGLVIIFLRKPISKAFTSTNSKTTT
ncbi:hypothetical protein [uncultured Kordia sp.]|uniref:hypothetical protein n=1 Tax=uncultured Kordia sp. TaxID=507699 RepID=UPI00260D225F|nr:hypothetical protein [uncultured Kordia sp.]